MRGLNAAQQRALLENLGNWSNAVMGGLLRLERRGVRWTAEEVAGRYTMEQFPDYTSKLGETMRLKLLLLRDPPEGRGDGRPVPPEEGDDQPEGHPSSSTRELKPATNEARQSAVDRHFL